MFDMYHADVHAEATSIHHYSCAVFERGEHCLADFLKNNRRIHQIQKVGIFHQLLQAVFFMHNEKGVFGGVVLSLNVHTYIILFPCLSDHRTSGFGDSCLRKMPELLCTDMVHCDIKPQNLVKFSASETWKLIDMATCCDEDDEVPIYFSLRYVPVVMHSFLHPEHIYPHICMGYAM